MPSLWGCWAHRRFNKQTFIIMIYNVNWNEKRNNSEHRVWDAMKELVNWEADGPRPTRILLFGGMVTVEVGKSWAMRTASQLHRSPWSKKTVTLTWLHPQKLRNSVPSRSHLGEANLCPQAHRGLCMRPDGQWAQQTCPPGLENHCPEGIYPGERWSEGT